MLFLPKETFLKIQNMKALKSHFPFLSLIILITLIVFLRVFIPVPNVTPVAAIALFGAAYIRRKELAVFLPLIILFVSDIILGLYSPVLMAGVYGSFVLISFIGFYLLRKISFSRLVAGSLVSSVIFFIVTNFVVWAEGLWYPMTLSGLFNCYYLALPFFRYEIAGTLVFTLFFFYSYSLIAEKSFSLHKV